MTAEKIEIELHDRSVVQVSRTDAGAVYLEVYAAGNARDGHGMLLRGSALLTEADASALRDLLTSPAAREAA